MRNGMIKAAGLLGFALLLAGIVTATDSSFYWSDASGARGTLYWDSICLSNSTFGGTIVSGTTLSGNASGLTNLNGEYITAGNIAAARLAVAMALYDLASFTNGTLNNARLDADLQALAINNGLSLTNLTGGNISNGDILLARIAAALAMYDLASHTNGTLGNARLDADLQALAINNGLALTNLTAGNISNGDVPAARVAAAQAAYDLAGHTNGTLANERLDADLQALAINNGLSLTNLTGGNISNGDVTAARVAVALAAYNLAGHTNGTLASARLGNVDNTAITNALAVLKGAGYPWTTNVISGTTNIVMNAYGMIVTFQP